MTRIKGPLTQVKGPKDKGPNQKNQMHALEQLLRQKVANGLKKQSLHRPSEWACQYRVMGNPFPGKWTFYYHPWLREPHDSTADFNVVMKGAQLGFTEWALNRTFFNIDILNNDCLYVLPGEGDAGDFSAGRFDPALEASTYLRHLFHNVRNVGHKRAGTANLYIRGSRSRSKLKSIPTRRITFDEVDEMTQANIPLAMERASGQTSREIDMLSTPTIEKSDYGICGYYNLSTQEHYFFPCPHCGRQIELLPENLVVGDPLSKSHMICLLCKGKLAHEDKPEFLSKGKYVPTCDADYRGFTVNQLYSSAFAGKPEELARAVVEAENDPAKEQELYNSKFAMPHTVAGARLSDADIDKCIKDGVTGPIITMGVDVGRIIYYVIHAYKVVARGNDINEVTQCRLVQAGKVHDFENLDTLMKKYAIQSCVVDRHPETRAAYQFASRFWGKVLLCIYGRGVSGKQLNVGTDLQVTVDRTSWLDCFYNRLHNCTITFPPPVEEYRTHLKNLVRHFEKDQYGNPVARYISTGPDHFAHASNYAEIALAFAASEGHQNITKVT